MDSGVHASLFLKCHRELIFTKKNFEVNFPPPYGKLIWDYSKYINVISYKRSLKLTGKNPWQNLTVNDQVKFLTDCVINIFINFVPNKEIICEDKDHPCMNSEIRLVCKKKIKKI